MGRDKIFLRPPMGNAPDMLTRTAELLERHTEQVIISARDDLNAGPWRKIVDLFPDCGPFGGIYSVLHSVKDDLLVLSVDLPFMDDATVQNLIDERNRQPNCLMTAYRQKESGIVESLVAIYDKSSLPCFERAHRQGQYRLNRIIPNKFCHFIPYNASATSVFCNLNTPDDYANAQKIATAKKQI